VKTEIDGKEESQPKKDTDDWDDIKAYKVNWYTDRYTSTKKGEPRGQGSRISSILSIS
jgi:hypothetical protein